MHILPIGRIATLIKLAAKRIRKSSTSRHRSLRFESLDVRRMLAMITVDTPLDVDNPNDGLTTLREAVAAAAPMGDTIDFAVPNGATITLDRTKGQIVIDGKSLTIDGGTLDITIDADDPTGGFHNNGDGIRIFNIIDTTAGSDPPSVTLVGMTLTGADPAPGSSTPEGGAIRSEGILTLRDIVIRECGAGTGAGIFLAVAAGGTTARDILTIETSTIEHNAAIGNGGGIHVVFASQANAADTVRILDSDISHNLAGATQGGNGGGINFAAGDPDVTNIVIVERSRFSINTANQGGAVNFSGGAPLRLTIQDSEISGNTAPAGGGGVFFRGYGTSHLQVSRSTISGNTAATATGGGSGGGLYIQLRDASSCTIEDSRITDNDADDDGGGVRVKVEEVTAASQFAPRSLTIARSVISGNTTKGRGGGLYNHNLDNAQTLIEDTRITDNEVPLILGTPANQGNGGGVYAYTTDHIAGDGKAKITISRSTVDNNKASKMGGGVFVCSKFNGDFVAVNSTISNNRTLDDTVEAAAGGGIIIARFGDDDSIDAFLHNVTITQNSSTSGGGLASKDLSGIRVRVANSIISENFNHNRTAPNNLVGRIIVGDFKHNLVGTGSDFRDHVNGNPAGTLDSSNILNNNSPLLGPLSYNGGFAPTHGLRYQPQDSIISPAIDAGSNALAKDPLTASMFTTDQRGTGFARPLDIAGVKGSGVTSTGFAVDIGAYEVGGLARVVDVRLDNPHHPTTNPTGWLRDAYSFAELVADGQQFRPISTQGVATISIHFSEHVRKRNANGTVSNIQSTPTEGNLLMQLRQTTRAAIGASDTVTVQATGFIYDPLTRVGTWTFAALPDGKYAIHLMAPAPGVAGLVDVFNRSLDSDWINRDNGTPDDFTDDPSPRLMSGGSNMPNGLENAFRFHFALLAGDYDGSGVVSADDLGELGDGNGDGVVSAADQSVTTNNLGDFLPLRRINGGDFDDDDEIDGGDLAVWRMNFAMGGNADMDGDGDTDGTDLTMWQHVIGDESAWGGVMAPTVVVPGNPPDPPPKVVNVIISGSTSQHAEFSFDTVDGSGAQLQSVPVGGADMITIVFSEGVNVSAESLIVIGMRTFNVPELVEFSYDPNTHWASWRFEGWAVADNYLLALSDMITDAAGNWLDGEWVNPATRTTVNAAVSEFPSGDGTPGGWFKFAVTLLPGDADGDGIVNGTDYSIWSQNYGVGEMFNQGDFDGNGTVNTADMLLWYDNQYSNLQQLKLQADFDGDCDVDDFDLDLIADNAGMTSATWEDGDLDGDGEVTLDDLDLALAQYGLELEVVS